MFREFSEGPSSFDEETDREDISASALLDRAFEMVLEGEEARGPEEADREWEGRKVFEEVGRRVGWLQP